MSKSPDAFRTISEVSDELDLPQHVLRFWETRFSQIKPLKRGGGRRYYRPDDVDLLSGIRHLLYDEGYTIRGVQRLLKENGNKFVIAYGRGEEPVPAEIAPAEEPVLALIPEEDIFQTAIPDSMLPAEAPLQSAVTVEDLAKNSSPDRKAPGLLNRLRKRTGEQSLDDTIDVSISVDDRRHLQATLYELLECKRLLDQVR
ncbi:MAG: MerR family transcriptional regulator [Rhizobiaceae bacterium]|nr:MerR family transcriptional regulator [Rhizobiaceae bacterium]